jgi:hypothetical protein
MIIIWRGCGSWSTVSASVMDLMRLSRCGGFKSSMSKTDTWAHAKKSEVRRGREKSGKKKSGRAGKKRGHDESCPYREKRGAGVGGKVGRVRVAVAQGHDAGARTDQGTGPTARPIADTGMVRGEPASGLRAPVVWSI